MNFFKKFEKLKVKYKTNKKRILSITVTAVGISCLLIGSSMAYLLFEASGTTQTISAGTLQLSYTNESEAIILNNAVPQSDEQGLNNNTYSITLTNTSTIKSYYELSLNNNCTVGNSYTVNGSGVTANVCIPNNYLKVAVKTNKDEDYTIKNGGNVILSGYLGAKENISFEMIIWLTEETPNDYQGQTETGTPRNVIYNGNFKIYTRQMLENEYFESSGANKPVLASNMIPVYYDETNDVWKKADASNTNKTNLWYSYESSGEYKGRWANAVTVKEANRQTYLNATPGTTISMDDINTMWVWIPRFNAVTPSNYNGGTDSAPGAIDVTFVDNETSAHDAFTFGTKNLSGFWYGKFETSHTTLASSTTNNNLGCTTETCSNANGIIIKPNVTILRYNNVSNFFYASRSMEQTNNSFGFVNSEVDTHMSKNNEWGAVAYLTQSIYGRCTSSTSCTEIGINNNSSYITGYGAPAGSSKSVTNGAYNTDLGKDASTTGNIYGIYDMSGGLWEYVMGVYTDGTQNWSGDTTTYNSGFTGMLYDGTTYTGVAYPESKYYNSYTNTGTYSSPVTNYTNDIQHALIETKKWYSDNASFVDSSNPWFIRGGSYYISSNAGVFSFNFNVGYASSYDSVRLVITNE